MPPNAQDGGGRGAASSNLKKRVVDLAESEIAIDGVVYTLEGFVHPGGNQIKLFGGNDVSVQYRMIHPFHTQAALSKMTPVGSAVAQTDYSFGSDFEKELKAEVAKIVKPNQRFATPGFWCRVIFYIALYTFLLFSYVYYGSTWQICVAFGIAQAFIGDSHTPQTLPSNSSFLAALHNIISPATASFATSLCVWSFFKGSTMCMAKSLRHAGLGLRVYG